MIGLRHLLPQAIEQGSVGRDDCDADGGRHGRMLSPLGSMGFSVRVHLLLHGFPDMLQTVHLPFLSAFHVSHDGRILSAH